jgi:hypothetical protein
MKLAPIALFVYNRPQHTKQTIEALKNNILAQESDLIIFSDGPKNNSSNYKKIDELRGYLKTISGFKSVEIVIREENFGLAKSIISGVTEVVNRFGKVIVLEDDMVTSKYFLKYMNESLDSYENNDSVISIHGYIYPTKKELPTTFFLKGADCWGWATWKRGWDLFENDSRKLLYEIKERKLTREFNFNNSYPYSQMLKGQYLGFNNSWAICWYASAFLKNKLTLYPGKSLISNIGLDDSGTHTGKADFFSTLAFDGEIKVEKIPIAEDELVKSIVIKYFKTSKLRLLNISMIIKFYLKLLKKYAKRK